MVKSIKQPAIVLAGGLGTRLRSVDSERPKPMVEIHGQPFLHWLILSLQSVGFEHFIFSTGYKSTYIEDYPWSTHFPKSEFEFVIEKEALGTGGALKNVFETKIELKSAWVINGDTLLENPHGASRPSLDDDVTYAALEPNQVFDAKANLVKTGNRITGVCEGDGSYFDGGQVFVTREAVESFEGKIPCSFHQLIEKSFAKNRVGFIQIPGTCYDIGTPERLNRFEKYLEKLKI